ncbi:LuxR C-terminal-related transcriptional regulator [Streptomyces sp. NPDC053728]|uniref:LuxR C-terminal-related transcriptional regulator n=1 Tax=Streptomyces sp. NPDC053728 TaxID=3155534 RepID=UPI00343FFF12
MTGGGIAAGPRVRPAARALGMQESTVKPHVSRILTTLGVTNRVQAAFLARDAGLTP